MKSSCNPLPRRPSAPGSPAAARMWTCPSPPKCGRYGTTPKRTAATWPRECVDEAGKPEAPFREILVWKFSRLTRKREHAVAFRSMLRRKGIRVVSITEHAGELPHRQADGGYHRVRGRVP